MPRPRPLSRAGGARGEAEAGVGAGLGLGFGLGLGTGLGPGAPGQEDVVGAAGRGDERMELLISDDVAHSRGGSEGAEEDVYAQSYVGVEGWTHTWQTTQADVYESTTWRTLV